MIKLVAIEPNSGTRLLLRFSDDAWGICDFAQFTDAGTGMTASLREPRFFARHFIEAGALAWPNGFDLSAASLYRRLEASGGLRRNVAAA